MGMAHAAKAKFHKWFFDQFLVWSKKMGSPQSGVEFAKFLGISQPSVSRWLNGEGGPPRGLYVDRIAEKLGDEIYDVLGRPRPKPEDSDLAHVVVHWKEFAPDAKRRALAILFGDDERRGDIKAAETEVAVRKPRKPA